MGNMPLNSIKGQKSRAGGGGGKSSIGAKDWGQMSYGGKGPGGSCRVV